MAKALNELFEKYIPNHDIPDDLQAGEAMGLPFELACDEPKDKPKEDMGFRATMDEFIAAQFAKVDQKLKEDLENFKRLKEEADIAAKKDDTATPREEKEPIVAVPNADSPNLDQQKAKEESPAQEGKEENKTTRFGRGFDDWVDE
jgi:hypothetical protein